MTVPLSFNLRDINADFSERSQAIGGTAFLDGSGWTVSTGGGQSSPVISRSDTPGLTTLFSGAAGGTGSAWARMLPLALAAVVAIAVLRAVGR